MRRSRVISVPVYREALPSLTVLTRRSTGGVGRSLEPRKWSAALSAVSGLGFRGLGFKGFQAGHGIPSSKGSLKGSMKASGFGFGV